MLGAQLTTNASHRDIVSQLFSKENVSMKFPNLIERTVDTLLAEVHRPSTAHFDLVERFARRVPCHACFQFTSLPWRKDTDIHL